MGATVRTLDPLASRVTRGTGVPRIDFTPRDVVLVAGKRGTGKSSGVKGLVHRALGEGWPVLAWDPHDEVPRGTGAKSQRCAWGRWTTG